MSSRAEMIGQNVRDNPVNLLLARPSCDARWQKWSNALPVAEVRPAPAPQSAPLRPARCSRLPAQTFCRWHWCDSRDVSTLCACRSSALYSVIAVCIMSRLHASY